MKCSTGGMPFLTGVSTMRGFALARSFASQAGSDAAKGLQEAITPQARAPVCHVEQHPALTFLLGTKMSM